ncbi:MAG: T9SS type A sorting domain-containing protein [Saprospiraceae bacterium]
MILNIKLEVEADAIVTVYNLYGQAVKNIQLTDKTNAISFNDLANGTYYVQIRNGNTVENHKVVKQ